MIRDPRDPHAFRFLPRPPELAAVNPSNDVELLLRRAVLDKMSSTK